MENGNFKNFEKSYKFKPENTMREDENRENYPNLELGYKNKDENFVSFKNLKNSDKFDKNSENNNIQEDSNPFQQR